MKLALEVLQLVIDKLGPDLIAAHKNGQVEPSITLSCTATKDGESHFFTFVLAVEDTPVEVDGEDDEFDPNVECDCDECRSERIIN